MEAANRLIVPTCIGCGSMSEFGTCEDGCREQELELVPGRDLDRLRAHVAGIRLCADSFVALVRRFATHRPRPEGFELAYRTFQQAARGALHQYPKGSSRDRGREEPYEPSERVRAWWCPRCGGIDAPQPCVGICIRRPVEWVNASLYERERRVALAELERERLLRGLLRDLAFVTPRDGQWQRGWNALVARAGETLAACDETSGITCEPVRGDITCPPRRSANDGGGELRR